MIFGWGKTRQAAPQDPPRPDVPLCAIGDIHGRADLLDRALKQADGQIVCLGDYIDRGPDSAGVLRRLAARDGIICLMGNHEEMLLDFLDAPARAGPRWLFNGGLQTLASFGIEAEARTDDAVELTAWRDALATAMGPALEIWLRALPSWHLSGNVALTHAGGDPTRAIDAQKTKHLHWGHPKLGLTPRRDGLWVIRGHVIYDDPLIENGVISVDTGAWCTGRLTLAHVSAEGIQFSDA